MLFRVIVVLFLIGDKYSLGCIINRPLTNGVINVEVLVGSGNVHLQLI